MQIDYSITSIVERVSLFEASEIRPRYNLNYQESRK